jgi:hypothetical protein
MGRRHPISSGGQEAMMADAPGEDFALTLTGDGISIEKRVSKEVALAVVAAVLGNGPTPATAAHRDTDQRRVFGPASSPREFLRESHASTNPQKIATFGYYVCQHEAKENFSTEDLKEQFRKAHEVIPRNVSRDLGTAIKMGWVHEVPDKRGRYYMTNTGMQLVETKFGRTK